MSLWIDFICDGLMTNGELARTSAGPALTNPEYCYSFENSNPGFMTGGLKVSVASIRSLAKEAGWSVSISGKLYCPYCVKAGRDHA